MTTDALQALEKWKRKHYRARLIGPGHVQPGEGWYIELEAAGRKVFLSEEDERYELENPPGLARLILDALKMWHADPLPKPHDALIRANETPEVTGEFVAARRWGNTGMHLVRLFAANEAEVHRKLADRDVPKGHVLEVWEMRLVGTEKNVWSH